MQLVHRGCFWDEITAWPLSGGIRCWTGVQSRNAPLWLNCSGFTTYLLPAVLRNQFLAKPSQPCSFSGRKTALMSLLGESPWLGCTGNLIE